MASTKTLGIRVDEATLARLEALAVKLSRPGLEITVTAATRLVIETGLTAEEEKLKNTRN